MLAFPVVGDLSQLLYPGFDDMIVLKFRTIQCIAAIHTECHRTSQENIPLEGSAILLPSRVLLTSYVRGLFMYVKKLMWIEGNLQHSSRGF